ncbi:hypothetical protein FM038_013160 [Shewanella eurypsychrophilus]|uniref:NrS-1 polymerase-like helicase domain-containing protein n=1 Tax=Shewanella eurypsychrophilus TaxID=2593656 RepID=A0ABX6V7I4_9GAMM|nr:MULTISPECIES: DUF5906 domain-containing protein [Shewanella]QFU23004.1 hypothetical protein FS418_14745 [Shewanella sp. YLB-09]QPG58290.1 hypothetical protein FM038_013160 [Shewanella eurypsychrophilus]
MEVEERLAQARADELDAKDMLAEAKTALELADDKVSARVVVAECRELAVVAKNDIERLKVEAQGVSDFDRDAARQVAVENARAVAAELVALGWYQTNTPNGLLIFKNRHSGAVMDYRSAQVRFGELDAACLAKYSKVIKHVEFRPDCGEYIDLGGDTWALNNYLDVSGGAVDELNGTAFGASDVGMFIELTSRVWPLECDREQGIKWLAHIVQKPAERPSVHMSVRSDHGTGKGLLFRTMDLVLHKQAVRLDSLEQYLSRFSVGDDGNLFTMVDESKSIGGGAYRQLKGKMADDTNMVEKKFENAHSQRVFSRLFFASNDKGANIPIEQDDRRFYICQYAEHKVSMADSKAFGAAYSSWLESGVISDIRDYLAEVDLGEWSPHDAIETEAKREYLGLCDTGVDHLIEVYELDVMNQSLWDGHAESLGYVEGFSYQELLKNRDSHFESKLQAQGWGKNKRHSCNTSGKKAMARSRGGLTGSQVVELVLAKSGSGMVESGYSKC